MATGVEVAGSVGATLASVHVELMVIQDCPHLAPAESLLRDTLSDMPGLEYRVTTVRPELPFPSGFGGSPTFVLNGKDLFEGGSSSYSCRRYPSAEGAMAGIPNRDELSRALRQDGART